MKPIKEYYLGLVEGVGEAPSWKNDWRWIVFYSLIVYAVVLAFRMSFAGRWDHPELWVNDERILATHDAYFWLAQAKGIGRIFPLGKFAGMLNSVLGIPLGDIGFWMPAIVSSFIGTLCCIWAIFLGGVHAGVLAGLIGALTPGFFFRSRLGYFDTDMFTMLGPVVVALQFAVYDSFWTKRAWFFSSANENSKFSISVAYAYGFAFVVGLVTRFFCMWHYDILNISILYFFLATFVLLVNAKPGLRHNGLYGLTIYLFAAFPGASYSQLGYGSLLLPIPYGFELTYIILAALLFGVLVFAETRKVKCFQNVWVSLLLLVFAIWLTDLAISPISGTIEKLAGYFQGNVDNTQVAVGQSVVEGVTYYPEIVKSIIEAKLVPFGEILQRGAFFAWLGWLALASSLILTVLRPTAVFLLPLVALQLLSVKFGVRFSMFGGPAFMVCLGVIVAFGVGELFARSKYKIVALIGVQIVIAGALLGHCYSSYSRLPLTPVLTKAHAEALIELGDLAPGDGTLWTWWDWGYASQYYAGMHTTVDGGLHSGKVLFPTALVMSTDSSIQANNMMRSVANHTVDRHGLGRFFDYWGGVPAKEAMERIFEMRFSVQNFSKVAPQYIAVTWNDMTLANWVTYFGNWNIESGTTNQASVSNFQPGQLGFNIQKGAVMNRKGGGGLVSDITILGKDGVDVKEYYSNRLSPRLLPKTRHLLINSVSKQSVLMDRIAYNSTMRRLLTDDPNDPEIRKYFKLVVDKLPFVRIYEVVQ